VSTPSSTGGELARATALLGQGQLVAAESVCRAILGRDPADAAATHVLGLIRKDAGDPIEGERLIRASIAMQPRESGFRVNLTNLLRRLDRLGEAETTYRETLAIDPRHRPARLGLVRTLNDLQRHAEAEAEARRLILAEGERDPLAWSALAMTLRDQLRLPEAEAAYRRAIAIEPRNVPAHHNLGSVLARMDRSEEALQALDRAATLGLTGFELAFNRGTALLQLYRLDEAEGAFAQAVAERPADIEAQANLARLRFMQGDADFARDVSAAAAAQRSDIGLAVLLSNVLRRGSDLPRAESLLRDTLARVGPSPDVRIALAGILLEAGRLKEAETEALEAAADRQDDPFIADTLVTIMLSRGRTADALPFIRRQRALAPLDQGWIALEATAARVLGDPLYQELYDYDRYVRSYDLESPPGYGSIDELNGALLEALNARHRFATHPLDQSLRNGSQTSRNLLADPDPAVRTILEAFRQPIEAYLEELGTHASHPLASRNRGSAAIVGAWSVQLRREGFHVNHFHPRGWISSAYYVAVPDEVNDTNLQSGWLKFGETRYPVAGAGPEGAVQPKAGRLVLFPSYMWHGTNPIHGAAPRTTIAFDAVPP
jgi:tetratricopeptide (TPR) repeat protein